MQTLKGRTSGSIYSIAYKIPCTIVSIGVFNRSGSTNVINIGVRVSSTDTYFKSFNLAATGTAGSSDLIETNVRVAPNWQIVISASGSCDYFLTIDNGS